jgi:cell division protein FtsQ
VAPRRQRAQGRPPRARAAVAALPRSRALRVPGARFLPSRRSLLVGFGLLAVALGAYAVARETAMFSVDKVVVDGAPPKIAKQARDAAAPLLGTSLLALDGAALERRLEALPTIVSIRYDRAFPHTLRLAVVPEEPVAVLRRGKEGWLVSARGRVIVRVVPRREPSYPRIWVSRATEVEPGEFLAAAAGGLTARTLALAARFPAHISAASLRRDQLVFRLRSGLELRLGEPTDVRLKLAIARRALRAVPAGTAYLDVSVPGRPVAGPDPQLSGGG